MEAGVRSGQLTPGDHLPPVRELAGQLGVAYAIPILYVPVLMITHVAAFYLLLRPQPKAVRALAGDAAAS